MSLMYAQMGLQALNTFGAFQSAKVQADINETLQDYNNTMQALSTARQLNTINSNQIGVRDAAARTAQDLMVQSLEQEANAEVAAASAGVAGASVKSTMRDLRGSAARARHARAATLAGQYRAFGQERSNVELAAIYRKDVSVIPQPSKASLMLGIASGALDVYDNHQTPGDKISNGSLSLGLSQ